MNSLYDKALEITEARRAEDRARRVAALELERSLMEAEPTATPIPFTFDTSPGTLRMTRREVLPQPAPPPAAEGSWRSPSREETALILRDIKREREAEKEAASISRMVESPAPFPANPFQYDLPVGPEFTPMYGTADRPMLPDNAVAALPADFQRDLQGMLDRGEVSVPQLERAYSPGGGAGIMTMADGSTFFVENELPITDAGFAQNEAAQSNAGLEFALSLLPPETVDRMLANTIEDRLSPKPPKAPKLVEIPTPEGGKTFIYEDEIVPGQVYAGPQKEDRIVRFGTSTGSSAYEFDLTEPQLRAIGSSVPRKDARRLHEKMLAIEGGGDEEWQDVLEAATTGKPADQVLARAAIRASAAGRPEIRSRILSLLGDNSALIRDLGLAQEEELQTDADLAAQSLP